MDKRKIYVTYGSDGKQLARTLLEASGALDTLTPGSKVALKPNLVVPRPANEGATTHPEIAEGVIIALLERGIKNISIIESAWVGASTTQAFRACGYETLSKKYNLPLFDLKRDATVEVSVDGERVVVSRRAKEADALINLPVLKAHCQTRLTCAIKNLKGCIPDSEKRRYHTQGLMSPIARLGVALPPAFTLVDAICGDLTFEEGGTPVRMDMAFIGRDSVAVDAYAASLLGYSPDDIEYIGLCERLGGGSRKSDIITLNTPGDMNNALTAAREGKEKRAKLARDVHEKDACSACVGALMRAKYRLDHTKKPPCTVYIGQGFKGSGGDGVGIGKCCSGFSRNVPGCPPTARDIYEALR